MKLNIKDNKLRIIWQVRHPSANVYQYTTDTVCVSVWTTIVIYLCFWNQKMIYVSAVLIPITTTGVYRLRNNLQSAAFLTRK